MKVFISWSGQISHSLATDLHAWLPTVLQTVQPFLSSEDIRKGSDWFSDIRTELEQADFGILCVTPDSVNAPWMLFEAGALSKKVDRARLCPLLVGLKATDLDRPLSGFNAATSERDDILKLLKSINASSGSEALNDHILEQTFASRWDAFAESLQKVLAAIRQSRTSTGCPLRSRMELPGMADWPPAREAKDILIIGQNLNFVLRQKSFFQQKLQNGGRLRLVIVNPEDEALLTVMRRGVVESTHIRADFGPTLDTIRSLRDALPKKDRSRIDLRTIDYVPTLSFQVLDGDTSSGTILVELAPNRIEVRNRPHLMLFVDDPSHTKWYQHFLKNCNDMYNCATPWQWYKT